MNAIKQIEILFWVTVIEHIILFIVVMSFLAKRWYEKRSRLDRRMDRIDEILDEMRGEMFAFKEIRRSEGKEE